MRQRRHKGGIGGDNRECGEVTTTVLLVPVALCLLLIVVQAALVFHARSVVTAAATDAARATQLEGATAADGRAVADQFLGSSSLLGATNITVARSGGRVIVDVDAQVTSLIPGWTPTVSAHAEGPAEEFRPATEP